MGRAFGPPRVVAEEFENLDLIEGWWDNGTDGFHQDLSTRPLIELHAVRDDQEGSP